MHLVVNQMVQLQHMHIADGYRTLECFTGTTVIHRHLVLTWRHTQTIRNLLRISQVEHPMNFGLMRAIEHRRREWHTVFQVVGQLDDVGIRECVQIFGATGFVINLLQESTHLSGLGMSCKHFAYAQTEALSGPTEVNFEHLTHIHT